MLEAANAGNHSRGEADIGDLWLRVSLDHWFEHRFGVYVGRLELSVGGFAEQSASRPRIALGSLDHQTVSYIDMTEIHLPVSFGRWSAHAHASASYDCMRGQVTGAPLSPFVGKANLPVVVGASILRQREQCLEVTVHVRAKSNKSKIP